MGDFDLDFECSFRNSLGRYEAIIERATGEAVAQAVAEAEAFGKGVVPRSGKRDPRTVSLSEGIIGEQKSRTTGTVKSTARHAAAVEYGTSAHLQPGNVRFFWENQGREWLPYASPEMHEDDFPGAPVIHHPPTAPQPYMDKIKNFLQRRIVEIAKDKYPG